MVWTEIDVDRRLTDAELRHATARMFGIGADRVRIVTDLATEISGLDPAVSLLIEHHAQPGDFPERVAFVIWDGTIVDSVGLREDSVESYTLLTTLASHLHASIIAPDSGADPYAGLLIEPSGHVYRVTFDQEMLDDLGGIGLPDKSHWTHVPELSHLPQRHILTS